MKFSPAIGLLLTGALIVTACQPTAGTGTSPTSAPAAATPAAGGGGTINVLLTQKVVDLHPLSGQRNAGFLIATMVFQDMLYAVGADNKYEPRLAERWEVSSDAKTWTFHLRKGIKWSDGQPFSSKDVLFTWTRYATPDASDQAGKLAVLKGRKDFVDGKTPTIAGLRAPDANTFVMELDEPNSALLSTFAWPVLPIIPEHILGNVPPKDLKTHAFFRNPTVSMGPFKLVRWLPDQFIEMERNPNYWKPVKADKVFLREMDPNVAVTAVEKGELDVMLTNGDDALRLERLPNLKVEAATSPGINKITIRREAAPFNDKRVRQAFLHAIDRKGIIDTVYKGRASIVNTDLRAPGTIPSGLDEYAYNPAKARQLLADAKWDPNYVYKLAYPVGSNDRKAYTEIIQANLAAVGVKSQITPLESGAFQEAITKRTVDGAAVGGGVYLIDGNSVAAPVNCNRFFPIGENLAHYCNPQVDQLFLQARTITDQTQRLALYQQIAKILNDEVSHFWISASDSVYARSTRLTGFRPNGDSTTFTVGIADWAKAQ
ncbi:MAG: ABC transporter substrate-binding protein [Chloroflexi bacterium]|nr:ABC transporter substrate-binding protein [Chloroflexota bacterium]